MRRAVTTAVTALSALAGSDAAAAAPTIAMAPEFVALSEITTPIFGQSRIEGALSVTLVVQAEDAGIAATLKEKMPELRAASLTVTLEFARLHASGLMPVDAARLSSDLNAALKRVHPGIARVLIVKLGAVTA